MARSGTGTVAREGISAGFWFVASTDGFTGVDAEELIGARERRPVDPGKRRGVLGGIGVRTAAEPLPVRSLARGPHREALPGPPVCCSGKKIYRSDGIRGRLPGMRNEHDTMMIGGGAAGPNAGTVTA
ncbi:hypothetical protein Nans01_46170 [Nocardiopsis ansamitocini]|uniref:Uncharacterized protein n=1 Tax=Nocardiopsis ansamitocini TaxID=1670832 RepID=A0A9W6UIT9_9ACTN|nr:hypothetical protein Nans01_46170 [Nocardiopsis ansamitocini]